MRLFGKGGSNFTSEDTNETPCAGMEAGGEEPARAYVLSLTHCRPANRSHDIEKKCSESISPSDRIGSERATTTTKLTVALGALSAVNERTKERMPPPLSPEKPIKKEGRLLCSVVLWPPIMTFLSVIHYGGCGVKGRS